MVYVDGLFYCHLPAPGFRTFSMGPSWCNITSTLIESDGKLLLCDHVSGYRVLTFNRARKDWFESDSLDDRALFLGSVGKASPLANTIHHFGSFSYVDYFYLLWKPAESDFLGEFLTSGPKISDYKTAN